MAVSGHSDDRRRLLRCRPPGLCIMWHVNVVCRGLSSSQHDQVRGKNATSVSRCEYDVRKVSDDALRFGLEGEESGPSPLQAQTRARWSTAPGRSKSKRPDDGSTTWRFESVRDGSPLSLSDRRRLCVGHCSATLRRLSFQMYRESGRPLRRVSRKQMLDAAKRGETRTWILSPRAILSWECRAALRHARHFMMQEPLPPCQPQLLL